LKCRIQVNCHSFSLAHLLSLKSSLQTQRFCYHKYKPAFRL
jgi:hypothetical protein